MTDNDKQDGAELARQFGMVAFLGPGWILSTVLNWEVNSLLDCCPNCVNYIW